MKKTLIITLSAAMLLTGCDTQAGMGAYTGGMFGSILGSAIGGISGGPRGSDIGTIVGMAGGAAVGAAVGQAADQARQQQREERRQQREAERAQRQEQQQSYQQPTDGQNDGSGYDPSNSGDDRLYDFGSSDYTGDYSASQPTASYPQQSGIGHQTQGFTYQPTIEIRNARFVDDNQDGKLQRGEIAKVIFEIFNNGDTPLLDVVPTVVEATGNKHIFISPNMHVESIAPRTGIRYTAMVKAENRLKNGAARFCVSAVQGNHAISKVSEFNIPTVK